MLVEKRDFFHTSLHSTPQLGKGVLVRVLSSLWCGKTRMVGLPDGEKKLRICITV